MSKSRSMRDGWLRATRGSVTGSDAIPGDRWFVRATSHAPSSCPASPQAWPEPFTNSGGASMSGSSGALSPATPPRALGSSAVSSDVGKAPPRGAVATGLQPARPCGRSTRPRSHAPPALPGALPAELASVVQEHGQHGQVFRTCTENSRCSQAGAYEGSPGTGRCSGRRCWAQTGRESGPSEGSEEPGRRSCCGWQQAAQRPGQGPCPGQQALRGARVASHVTGREVGMRSSVHQPSGAGGSWLKERLRAQEDP